MGIGFGLFAATVLTMWVSFLHLRAGSGPFAALNVTYQEVVVGYYLGGLAGGLLIGLAWPLRRWMLGCLVLGVLGVFPMYLFAPLNWTLLVTSPGAAILPSLIAATFLGGAVGAWAWSDDHPEGPHWFDVLRYPTRATVYRVWVAALLLAAASWYLIPHWSHRWPSGLVVVAAGVSFVLPLTIALLVTMHWRARPS